ENVATPRRMAHATDAPDLTGQGARSGSDLDAVVVEQLRAAEGLLGVQRNLDRRELGQPMSFGNEELEAKIEEAFLQEAAARLVPGPDALEALVEQSPEGGVQ